MKRRVYIETSIPSFYFDTRPQPEMMARRLWTRKWWHENRHQFELVTSVAVWAELEGGNWPNGTRAMGLMNSGERWEVREEIADIARVYIARGVMPVDPAGDALHLAVASFHRCDYLLTLNCQHLANARKFAHIRAVNTILGLDVSELVTPLELMSGKEEMP